MNQPISQINSHSHRFVSHTHRLPDPRVLTVKEFHNAIGGAIGLNSLYELARCGRLKTIRIGRKLLVLASEVDNFFLREAGVN